MAIAEKLKIENLALSFNERKVFDNISAMIEPGEKIQVTGASGSGKSSLLKCLLGFNTAQGSIFYGNERLTSSSVWKIRTMIAYVPQEPLFQHSTVEEQLKSPFSFKANSHLKYNETEIDNLLAEFLLPLSIKKANTDQLSGGEKQRIAIISALSLKRKYIFFDEPTSALDPACKKVFWDIVARIKDTTCLIISHDSDVAISFDGLISVANISGEVI
ncbi:MAG: ATP-binding cassette domain-containing protein [Sedimentisphaeraceae bacterium JB056]